VNKLAIIAYVLIYAEVGKAFEVLDKVRKVKGVSEAHAITGEYDVIAKVEVENLKDLGEKVVGEIHKIEGVTKTVTAIVVE